MEKRTRNFLFVIISLLTLSNLLILIFLCFKPHPHACKECATPIPNIHNVHNKGLIKIDSNPLQLSTKQKKKMKICWDRLKNEATQTTDSIKAIHKQLIAEMSAETLNHTTIGSLEDRLLKHYHILLHQTLLEYPNVVSFLNEDQIKAIETMYFDIFFRIYSIPPRINSIECPVPVHDPALHLCAPHPPHGYVDCSFIK